MLLFMSETDIGKKLNFSALRTRCTMNTEILADVTVS